MTKIQLEWWILFGICVAGKSAKQTQAKVEALLNDMHDPASPTPFGCVRTAITYGKLGRMLRKHRIGQYTRINKAFRAAVKLDLDNLTIEALEAVPGIGPKTARMTILYYEPNASVVPLDTHILKFLRSRGYDAPKSTPPAGGKYLLLEQAFIAEAKKRNMTVRDLDTQVWQQYATT